MTTVAMSSEAAAMVNALDVLPIIALALMIVFIPLLGDGAPLR